MTNEQTTKPEILSPDTQGKALLTFVTGWMQQARDLCINAGDYGVLADIHILMDQCIDVTQEM